MVDDENTDRTPEERTVLLDYLFEAGMEYLNAQVDIQDIVRTYCGGEERTAKFLIKGLTDKGFAMTKDGIVNMGELNKPTCTLVMSEDTFIAFVNGTITFSDVVYIEDTEILGTYAVRDIDLFRKLFNKFKDVWVTFGTKFL